MADWSDCVVSYIDLIGIKRLLESNSREAINLMRRMHQKVRRQSLLSMPSHHQIYYWNDSVLALAFVSSDFSYEPIMKELNFLKLEIDAISDCYAICMKGMAIPELISSDEEQLVNEALDSQKAVYIKASSMAFTNCFEVENKLGHYRKSWYVDRRIVKRLNITQTYMTRRIKLFPRRVYRTIFMYDRNLWRS